MSKINNDRLIVLFDGLCNFCNGTVNFIIDRDKKDRFRFAALQSDAGQKLSKRFNLKATDFDTFIVVEGDKYYERSSAAFKIAKELGGFWKLFLFFTVVPRFIRDFFYDIVARNRYKWFGKRDACRIPTTQEKRKFLE